MCNLYTHRRPQEAMRQLFAGLDDRGVNLAPADFYPDQRAPIIRHAAEGGLALALARQHHPDLILMDIQLPEISGLEVTKWLKDDDELNHIPVIAVTAFAMKGDEERIRQGGCEAYISKPISVMHFLDTVRKHLQ